MKIFSERLKDLRLEKGISQRKLAEAVNLSPSAIKQWENGTRTPNAIAVVALAKYFEISSDFLLGLE